MEVFYSDQQLEYKSKANEVTHEILSEANKYEREEKIPVGAIEKIAHQGFLGLHISREYGGLEEDYISIGLVNEEMAKESPSLRGLLTVQGMVSIAIERWGTEKQKKQWLPLMVTGKKVGAFALSEPEAGSDIKSIQTEARREGNMLLLTGKKKWISLGQIADVFLVLAKCEGKDVALLVERATPGLSIQPINGLLGLKMSMLAEVTFDQCKIPEECIVGGLGSGLSHVALSALDFGRYTVAWGCVGICQGTLEESVQYSRKRKQFGEKLRKHQLIQKLITEMAVNTKASRMLCYSAALLKNKHDPSSIMETWYAKYFSSKAATNNAKHCVQILGAEGCMEESKASKFYRDAKIMEIIEGTSQMHELLIATDVVRSYK